MISGSAGTSLRFHQGRGEDNSYVICILPVQGCFFTFLDFIVRIYRTFLNMSHSYLLTFDSTLLIAVFRMENVSTAHYNTIPSVSSYA